VSILGGNSDDLVSVPPKMGALVVISLFQLIYKKLQSIEGFSKEGISKNSTHTVGREPF